MPQGSQPSGASRSVTALLPSGHTVSRRYSQRCGRSESRWLTNMPRRSTRSTSQPCSPNSLSRRSSAKMSAVHDQLSPAEAARPSPAVPSSPAAPVSPPRLSAKAATGPNSSSGSAPLSATCPASSSIVEATRSAGTPLSRSSAASSSK
ncbi:hypothetical protein GCM10010140_30840 [Streptosporangium pseudovulgare]|uniref:Uncharacterized protein n=1 Tax=Streptosporangium pseudovulgare TaxID=35765 RepID=A0ABQ2QUS9_9ACTN|nr:hypothetical protein GCM10010140_30840 [Streptosporangium pseudovulgare]